MSTMMTACNNVNENHEDVLPEEKGMSCLTDGSWDFEGYLNDMICLVESEQVKSKSLWTKCVNPFKRKTDGDFGGWNAEYWGKVMRGACFIYRYTQDEELYATLKDTTLNLLSTEDDLGRITTYTVETEFTGWDLWGRKYVLLGLEYFYEICKEEDLKQKMVDSMCRQLDYIMQFIGEGEGKTAITDAAPDWDGMTASSMLEPVVKLYSITGKKAYLEFATHIVNSGAIRSGDIFELAYEGEKYPYQYPVHKAYEMMSCFEGLLEYYKVTGETKWLTALNHFMEKLIASEVTLVGGLGCNVEEFDHAQVEQCNPDNIDRMQETCVTVTWMKLCLKMLELTGNPDYADEFEKSLYNVYLGAINSEHSTNNGGFIFDSYSPTIMSTRGQGVAGYSEFYGCCVAMGPAGVGMIALMSTMKTDSGFAVNLYIPGSIKATTPGGQKAQFDFTTNFPSDGKVKIILSLDEEETFQMKLRIPDWSKNTKIRINGENVDGVVCGEYFSSTKNWKDGDVIELELDMTPKLISAPSGSKNENSTAHVAIKVGPIVLARDSRLDNGEIDEVVDILLNAQGEISLRQSNTAQFEPQFEYEITQTDGSVFHMVDYASAGKTLSRDSVMTVWMPVEDYFSVDFSKPVLAEGLISGKIAGFSASKEYLEKAIAETAITDVQTYAWNFEETDDGCYRIKVGRTGQYLSIVSKKYSEGGAKLILTDASESDLQKWKIVKIAQNRFLLQNKKTNALLTEDGSSNWVHMWPDVNNNLQVWIIKNID